MTASSARLLCQQDIILLSLSTFQVQINMKVAICCGLLVGLLHLLAVTQTEGKHLSTQRQICMVYEMAHRQIKLY